MKSIQFLLILLSMAVMHVQCTSDNNDPGGTTPPPPPPPQPKVEVPNFDENMAYDFVQKQVDFGPRVPGTAAHDSCAQWLVNKFDEFGAETMIQEGEMRRHDGVMLPLKNIIASYNPSMQKRILLCAHWDTRYISDQETDPELRQQPVLGADDGGSGVGILLEIARVLNENPIDIGIDIVLFDIEDQGLSGAPMRMSTSETWCLGSQYWSRNPHKPGYKADFGILLDMVGAKGATFPQEQFSIENANFVVQKIWGTARDLGYDNFKGATGREITDDHVFVTLIAKIPTADIISLPEGTATGFGHFWHTTRDNMSNIDRFTLETVGETVLHVIYKEAAGVF